MSPFREPTCLRVYEEFMELSNNITEISKNKNLSLKDLKLLAKLTEKAFILTEELTNASSIEKMFLEDAKRIKEAYLNNTLSKAEAEKALRDLKECARKLLQEIPDSSRKQCRQIVFISGDVERTFHELEGAFRAVIHNLEKFHKFSYPPEYGVPVSILVARIEEGIANIIGQGGELPKKEFGILQLSKTDHARVEEKVTAFLREYSSGVIIASDSDLKENVLETLKKHEELQIDEREIRNNYLFMVQPRGF